MGKILQILIIEKRDLAHAQTFCTRVRALHELTQNKMAEDAESVIAIRLVDENDYREISAKAVSAKRKLKKNRPSSLV